jgi:hypothetical protein
MGGLLIVVVVVAPTAQTPADAHRELAQVVVEAYGL